MENSIKQEIILHEHRPEWLVPVPMELDWRIVQEASFEPSFGILVYRYDGRVSANEYRYVFVGLRINSLPNKGLQADLGVCSCEVPITGGDDIRPICRKCGKPQAAKA